MHHPTVLFPQLYLAVLVVLRGDESQETKWRPWQAEGMNSRSGSMERSAVGKSHSLQSLSPVFKYQGGGVLLD